MLANRLLPFAAFLSGAAVAQNVKLRYMPLGDSITEVVCWRSKLWQMLQMTEWADVDWVGNSKLDNFCGDATYDRDNEGHSGFLAVGIANLRLLPSWLQANPADVITVHLGTNDILQGRQVPEIIAAFTMLVGDMRNSNPKIKIIVSKNLGMPSSYAQARLLFNFSPCVEPYRPTYIDSYRQVAQIIPNAADVFGLVQSLNSAIVTWAQCLNSTESPIWVVDQHAGFSTTADLRDGLHPNDSGDQKMANVWYPALVNAFKVARADKLLDACQTCWSANAASGQERLLRANRHAELDCRGIHTLDN